MTCPGEQFADAVAARQDDLEDAAEDAALRAQADADFDRVFLRGRFPQVPTGLAAPDRRIYCYRCAAVHDDTCPLGGAA